MALQVQSVLIPGILGSRLSTNSLFGVKTAVWPNPALLQSNPLALALAADGKSPYPLLGWSCFPDGPVGLGLYDSVQSTLQAHLPDCYFWSYDWRLDLRSLASQLVQTLQGLNFLGANFHVVCHSMGGLIAQLAYPLWVAAGNSPRWADTFYLSTPHGGAHWASMCLNGLFYDGALVNLLGQIFNLAVQASPLVAAAYSALAGTIGTMVGSWPAVYQLLPSNLGPWAGLDPLVGQALQISNYLAGPGGVQQQWLTAAAAVQQQLVTLLAQPRPFELVQTGTGNSTPRAFAAGLSPQSLTGYLYTDRGDGTVANERATLASALTWSYAGSTHNGMCTSNVVLNDLWTLLLNHPATPGTGQDVPFNPKPVFISPPPPPTAPMETWAFDFANKYADP